MCWHHRWEKWSEPERMSMVFPDQAPGVQMWQLYQHRICLKCGLVQWLRVEGTPLSPS